MLRAGAVEASPRLPRHRRCPAGTWPVPGADPVPPRGRGRYVGGVSDRPEQAVECRGTRRTAADHARPRPGGSGRTCSAVPERPPATGRRRLPRAPARRRRGYPVDRASAWMWLLYAALGFLGGQVLAAVFVVGAAAIGREATTSSPPSPNSPSPPPGTSCPPCSGCGPVLRRGLARQPVRGTKQPGARPRAPVPVDRPARHPHRGRRPVPRGADVRAHQPHVHDFNQRFDAPASGSPGDPTAPGTS